MLDKQQISWNHIVSLKQGDQNLKTPGLYCTKLRSEHINLTSRTRMKVNLAAQVLSSTVADALKMQKRTDTKGTETFCRNFDKFFDCLNVQYKDQGRNERKESKKAYYSENDSRFGWLKDTFLEGYINRWQKQSLAIPELSKKEQNRLCLSSQTIEGLRITVNSMVDLLQTLLRTYKGFYVLTGKFSQDPIEQHFSAQRRRCGGSTNPNMFRVLYNEQALASIKSRNVASLKGNTKVEAKNQVGFMEKNSISLKRRKREKRKHEEKM